LAAFFDLVSKEWLVPFVEHRIGNKRIIRLIRKWLKAGVLEDGVVTVSEVGTGQGSVISTAARQHLHALRVRSVGQPLATAGGTGRRDYREVRRRL
jgi:retron-type reverse transcriptase